MQIELSSKARPLNQYPLYWAECFGTAPMLPMSRAEMEAARLGQLRHHHRHRRRLRRSSQFRHGDHRPPAGSAGLSASASSRSPTGTRPTPFSALGKPNLFFGVTAGNMDSMINRYTADRKIRSDDAYSPDDVGGKRPDRCSIVYAQRCREAYARYADRHRRHRGVIAPHRPLRLLAGQGAPLHPRRRQGRHAALRQCRARAGGTGPPARRR